MKRYLSCLTLALALGAVACGSDDPTTIGDPEHPGEPLTLAVTGTGAIDHRYTAEIAVAPGVAYTTTWGSRPDPGNTTYVWDLSKAQPLLVDSLQIEDVQTMGDVQISPDGRYLVVATERANGSIVIWDRSADPLHPTFVGRYISPHTTDGVHTMKMSVIGGRLYGFLQIDPTTGPARETIVDMTDPRNITEVYSQTMGRPYVHDVFVRDGYLFAAVWNDGMTIFDIGGGQSGGSPPHPVVIGSVAPASGQIHNIWWFHNPQNGEKKYAFLGEEGPGTPGSRSSGDIHVVDVSNLTNPKEVAIFRVPGAGTHNFWVDEASGVLYAAYYNAGVRAIDVRGDLGSCTSSQKTATGLCDLTLMGRLVGEGLTTDGAYVWGVQGMGNRLYASDMNHGLAVLDISSMKR